MGGGQKKQLEEENRVLKAELLNVWLAKVVVLVLIEDLCSNCGISAI
jgi:hypothetical protein